MSYKNILTLKSLNIKNIKKEDRWVVYFIYSIIIIIIFGFIRTTYLIYSFKKTIYPYYEKLQSNNIITKTNGFSRYSELLNKTEVLYIIFNLEKAGLINLNDDKNEIQNISSSERLKYISNILMKKGYMTGTKNKKGIYEINLKETITRYQFLKIMVSIFDLKENGNSGYSFTDITAEQSKIIKIAISNNLITDKVSFSPGNMLSIGEGWLILGKIIGLKHQF